MYLTDFHKLKILVIGDIMLDRYLIGNTTRISPEAPVPILKLEKKLNKLGGAGNVANNICSLAGKATIICAIGKDKCGKKISKLLKKTSIKSHLLESKKKTTVKTRLISKKSQLLRYDEEDLEDTEIDIENLKYLIEKEIKLNDAIIISDYNKGFLSEKIIKLIIKLSKKFNKKVFIDSKKNNFKIFSGAYLLKPNFSEFSKYLDKKIPNKDNLIEEKLIKTYSENQIKNIALTRAEKGISLVNSKGVIHFPSEKIEVFDVSGAGDTVISLLTLSITRGNSINDSMRLSNLGGAIVVNKSFTTSLDISALESKIYSKSALKSKNLNNTDFISKSKKLKKKGLKVVFTNGCFDIMHRGHISYLKKAKELGDILVVAINSDTSIKRIKSQDRPINNQKDRVFMLESFHFIDYVTIFEEDTPLNLIKAIKPDFLVKGGDYKLENIIGKNYAHKTVIIEEIEGYSSTSIIERINKTS